MQHSTVQFIELMPGPRGRYVVESSVCVLPMVESRGPCPPRVFDSWQIKPVPGLLCYDDERFLPMVESRRSCPPRVFDCGCGNSGNCQGQLCAMYSMVGGGCRASTKGAAVPRSVLRLPRVTVRWYLEANFVGLSSRVTTLS